VDLYEEWYGLTHPHPELYEEARYGLVELHRGELTGANLVANPGCNASAAILALAPLASAGLLGDGVNVHIMAGVSGAGRGAAGALHFPEANENVRPYKVAGGHRHTAEIELTLARAAQAASKELRSGARVDGPRVAFNPHLVPMVRGILATCSTRPSRGVTESEIRELYRDFYAGDALIHVQDELPETKAVAGSDRTLLSTRLDERTGTVLVFSALDNLGKGASGQAVQNFNVMHDLPEALGLELEGRWP